MHNKYSFKELYTRFCGSGKIDSKYWVIGIEPGGDIRTDDRFSKAIESGEQEVIDYFNDYNDEDIRMKSLFNSILVNILKSNNEMSSAIDEVDGKIVINYSDTCIFRTNLFMLTFQKDNQVKFQDGLKYYMKYIDFEQTEYNSKYELYERYLSIRAEHLITNCNGGKISNKNSEKVIFALTRTYENLLLKFLSGIFQAELSLKKEIRKSDLPDLSDRSVIKKYMNLDKSIKIYSFPQNRRLGKETIKKAIQLLDS